MKHTVNNPINKETITNLKNKIEQCIGYYEECKCVYENPL